MTNQEHLQTLLRLIQDKRRKIDNSMIRLEQAILASSEPASVTSCTRAIASTFSEIHHLLDTIDIVAKDI